MPAKRWMDFADLANAVRMRMATAFLRRSRRSPGEVSTSAEPERGRGELGCDEVHALAESRRPAKVRASSACVRSSSRPGEARRYASRAARVESRAGSLLPRQRAGGHTGRLDKIEDVYFSAGDDSSVQCRAASLRIRYRGGLAPPAKQPDASITAKLTIIRNWGSVRGG